MVFCASPHFEVSTGMCVCVCVRACMRGCAWCVWCMCVRVLAGRARLPGDCKLAQYLLIVNKASFGNRFSCRG